MKNDLITLTETLVRCDSVASHPREIRRAFDLVGRFFNHVPVVTKSFIVDGIETRLYVPRGVKQPRILFCGHLDIVPCEKNQLRMRRSGTRLIGRGTYDMKGPIAAMASAMRDILHASPHASVGLLLSGDEEHGGFHGVGDWVQKHSKQLPEVVFIPDGGDGFAAVTEEKGVLNVVVECTGKTGHGSRPWEGRNAIQQASDGIQKLRNAFPDPRGFLDWKTSVVPTRFDAGIADNQIPGAARIFLDIRHVPKDAPTSVLRKIARCFPKQRIRVMRVGSSFSTPITSRPFRHLRQTYQNVLGKKLKTMHFPSACDARFFAAHNVPVLLMRPPGGGAHGPDEWTSLPGLEQYAHVLREYVQTYS